jgi:ankyrin repeat protein
MAASSLGIVDHLRSGFSPDGPSTNGSFDIPTTTSQTSNDLPSMLAMVIGFPYNGQIADVIPSFVTKLQALVPERHPGELNTQVQAFSDPFQKPSIFPLLEVAAYFCSNNMLQTPQVATFVEWVIEHNHAKSLTLFLRLRRDMLSVKAFIISLLEAGAFVKSQEFLRQLHAIGAKFDHVAAELVKINDPKFQAFVLSTLDPELLKGESGGRLLRSVARTQAIEVAEVLIQAGAKVNVSQSEEVPTPPLWEAIHCDNFEMVKCLVRAGADVNKRTFAPSGIPAVGPLSIAVWKNNKRVVEYLLDQNAVIQGYVYGMPLLQYAAENASDIYELLMKKMGSAPETTVGQLVKAANLDARLLLDFLSQHPQVSERMLEEAMVEALKKRKTQAIVNFLQHGVDPNGSHIPDSRNRPLIVAAMTDPGYRSSGLHYIDLLIHAQVDVNIDGLLEEIVWEEESSPIVDKLINAGLDLTQYGPAAIEREMMDRENTDVLVLLIDRGSPINNYGHRLTPFQAIALSQNLELLQYCFKKGAEVNKPAFPVRGYTALQAAAKDCSIEKIQYLLSMGADINAPPAVTGGVTVLEATVRPWESFFAGIEDEVYFEEQYLEESGLVETFIFLLSEGAAANRPDGSSSPLLHDIIERWNTHLLKLALEAGADTTHQWQTPSSSWCERTPLQLAAEMGQTDAVKLLLDHQADPNALPAHRHGMTALQAAASSEAACMETVELLLTAGAAINADPAAVGGISALQGAAIKGHFQIAMLLIEKGANVNAPPAIKDGRTAIEGAAEHGRLDMVQMLLNAGAIGDVIRKTGLTKAISLARKNRHFAVVDLLESH